MSNLNKPSVTIDHFIQNVFQPDPKPVFFWDSCSILDILRLPYRKGTLDTLKAYLAIKALTDAGAIYSVCSALTIIEWNDHFAHTLDETQRNLDMTSFFHKNSVDMINHIFSTTYTSVHIGDKGLSAELETIADSIIQDCYFLGTDEIAPSALARVAAKKPPAGKKPEFKDCAIWETVLEVANDIKGTGNRTVFFSVNTEDYVNKGRTPNIIHDNINSEAVIYSIDIALDCQDALVKISAALPPPIPAA